MTRLRSIRLILLGSAMLLSYANASLMPSHPPSVFCSSRYDSRTSTLFLQLVGLALDVAITILLSRTLSDKRTGKRRLAALGIVSGLSSLGVGVLSLLAALSRLRGTSSIGSISMFDVLTDGSAAAVLIISTSRIAHKSSPGVPAALLTFVYGALESVQAILRIGTWQHNPYSKPLQPLIPLYFGLIIYLYARDIRFGIFIRRIYIVIVLAYAVAGAWLYSSRQRIIFDEHPLQRIIYDARVRSDAWRIHASISQRLAVAVDEYRERNHGREPPPGFGKWYSFATNKKSVVIDQFEQISNDLLPFWAVPPAEIRRQVASLATEPKVVMVTVLGGVVSHSEVSNPEHKKVLEDFIKMTKPFALNLPDMQLPINLDDRPRVLPRYSETRGLVKAALKGKPRILARDVGLEVDETSEPPRNETSEGSAQEDSDKQNAEEQPPETQAAGNQGPAHDPPPVTKPLSWTFTSAQEFRHMQSLACPPRTGFKKARDFCSSCAAPHSQGQFLIDYDLSQDTCSQPDLIHLHGFFMRPPPTRPIQKMVPMFSRYKAAGFSDILIPLSNPGDDTPETENRFYYKHDRLFWTGTVGQGASDRNILREHHRHRLLHLVNNSTETDRVVVLLPTLADNKKYRYEPVSARLADTILPINIEAYDHAGCMGRDCDIAMQEFGRNTTSPPTLDSRFVLTVDSDSGPAPETLAAIRSGSVAFVASIFRHWYSERLMPWVHFVPIDLRWHALHSTLVYLDGLKGRGQLTSEELDFEAAIMDARWIAEEGTSWTAKAVRMEDMQIYLFRLLLEWGRLVDDARDTLAFKL